MAGSLWIGKNNRGTMPENYSFTGSIVNRSYYNAFGDLLNKVFQMEYSKLYMIIRSEEGESLDFYSFVELNKDEFNLAVRLIRQYIANISEPTDWQLLGKSTWETIAEPLVVKDERYDETASSINH